MIIYISHSSGFDYKKELYNPVEESEIAKRNILIFPHYNSNEQYPIKEKLQKKEISLIIAEVSYPSTGQGIELAWANIFGIKIVCCYKQNLKPSSSLKLICNDFLVYKNSNDLINQLSKILVL